MSVEGDAAERMRRACIEAALQAWEDAGVSGLCAEGRFEAAIDAMRRVAMPPADPPDNHDR